MAGYQRHVFVCTNERPPDSPKGSCTARGAEDVLAAFKREFRERGLDLTMRAQRAGCLDLQRRALLGQLRRRSLGGSVFDVRQPAAHPGRSPTGRRSTLRAGAVMPQWRLCAVVAARPDLVEAHRILVFAYASRGQREKAQAAVDDLLQRCSAEGRKLVEALGRAF